MAVGIIFAGAIFMVIRTMNKATGAFKKEEAAPAAPPEPSTEEKLLTETRDLLHAKEAPEPRVTAGVLHGGRRYHARMQLAVIVPAAGSSTRFNDDADPLMGPRSKLDEDLGGRTVLQRAIELFTKHPLARWIVVAGPREPAAHDRFMLRHGDVLGLLGATVCRGGAAHRYETIAAALEHVPEDATHVAVHDAARPCCPPELIDRLLDAAQHHAAVIPGVPVADTLKRTGRQVQLDVADPIGDLLGAPAAKPTPRTVLETVDRSELIAVQTPQVFEADLLRRAYAQSDLSSTDDAQLVERLGEPVVVIPGDARNLKITNPTDLPLARVVLGISGSPGRADHKRF